MKNGILRRIMALILVCTMLAGQVMVNVAYATDIGDIPIISDSEDNIIDFSNDESGNEPTDDDPDDTADFVPPAMFVLPDGDVSPLAEGDNGGISIEVKVSPENEVLQDGQECSLAVDIRDTDLKALPNIESGDKLTIKMPKFMKPQDVNHWLDNCYEFFESPAEYDSVNNVVVLTFKESQDTTLAISLNFSMVIDTIGYDGDGKGNIEIGIGDTVKDKVSTGEEIDIDDGTDSENGGGTTENKLYKRIWSNSKPSGSGDGLVIRDPKEPIGYSVSFNAKLDKRQTAVLSDDLSNGNLVLCNLTGETDVPLSDVFTVIVGGKTLTERKPDEDSLVFSNTSLGTITIAKTENGGFTVTCENTTDADMTGQVSVVVKYYAKAVGDASYFNNRVKLSIGGETFSDSTFIRKYDNAGLYASKSIGESGAEFIDIEDQAEVTFCIKLTQYGVGSSFKANDVVTFDVLEDCFIFDENDQNSVSYSPELCEQLFTLKIDREQSDGKKVQIVKNNDDNIPAGTYKIYFTVSIDSNKLNYGEVATNTVGNTVFIRRKAKLTINKEWLGENIYKGSGARFVLCDGDTPIAYSGNLTVAENYTLYIPASALERGEHTYTLKEEVDPNSGYQAAKPVSVVIKRAYGEKDVPDDTVTIISINGIDNTSGSANVAVQNEPDSGMGSLTFKKYGSSDDDEGNILPGGTYKLYRVDNGTNTVVEVNGQDSFTTYNGVITISPLPYGTYYVEEISAPSGYVIEGGATGQITLNKTNPHGTVSLVNKPFTSGEIEILKVDEKNQPLSGVEFKLTGAKSETKTTGSDGKVTFSGLTAGYYTITETLPFGYSGFAGPINVTINEKLKAEEITAGPNVTAEGNRITINWVNTQQFGKIKLTKLGAKGTALAGAKFELSGNGITAITTVTNTQGEATFENLPFGTYTLKEIEAPAGYVISDELADGVKVTINSTEFVPLTYTNETQKGSIKITKVDANQESIVLSGATFGLYSSADCNNESRIDSKITGDDGTCTFDNLEAGTYYVKEISAPTGYQLNPEVFTFVLGPGANEAWSYERTVENSKRLYNLQLRKTNEDGKENLAGAEFELTGYDLKGQEVATQTVTTDANGTAKFTGLPFGTYTITEKTAPSGYAKLTEDIEITIDGSNTPEKYAPGYVINVKVDDKDYVANKHTKLTVLKVDDRNESVGLPGTTFVIKAGDQYVTATGGNGAYFYEGLVSTEGEATEFVTAAGGTFTLEYLPLGDYTLVEVDAPDGYVISEEPKHFKVESATPTVRVGNTQIKAKLCVVKTDGYGKLLPGIGFRLKNAEGYVSADYVNGVYQYVGLVGEETATVFTTGADGTFTLEGLLWGKYTLIEDSTTTPAGLIPAGGIDIAVTDDSTTWTITQDVVNELLLGKISLKKVDSSGNALAGAVFKLELVEGSGNNYSEQNVRYAVSGADGMVVFENVPYGKYKITEHLAPYGKTLSTEERTVTIDSAHKIYELDDWTNEDKEISVVFKKAGTDGTALTGAIFQILDENDNVVKVLPINSKEGEKVELAVGTYYLKEIKAPTNYVLNTELIEFRVTENGSNKPIEVVMKNEPVTGSLTIAKSDKATSERLAGAEFKVYSKSDYENGAENARALYTVTTNSDGRATINNIPFGEYAVVETKAPAGYELDNTPQYFTIGELNETVQTEIGLEFTDEKSRYVLEISKVDINSQKALSGAKFAVYSSNFYKEVEVGSDGKAIVEVPSTGTYYVTEIAAPEGYTIDPNVYTVEVDGHTAAEAAIKAQFVSQDYPTQIRIKKVDGNNEALGGALFQIFRVTENGEELMAFTLKDGSYQYSTDSNNADIAAGEVLIKGLPKGNYVLKETKAPDGYMVLGDISFTVSEESYDKELVITAQNLPYQRGVAVCKENEKGVRLAGAEFTLYSENDEKLQSVTTGASGYAVFTNLGSGSYYIMETAAPEGYQKIDTRFDFRIDENGELQSGHTFVNRGSDEEPFYVITLTNTPVEHQFRLKKVSSANGSLLAGAQFRILGSGVNNVYTTGDDGLTDVIQLPVGEYMLTEIKAPSGYIINTESHHLVVKADGIKMDGEALTGEFPVITFENEPQSFRFAILKQDGTKKQPLSGAIFVVTGEDGSKVTLATGDDGYTDVISLKPGKYAVTETKAPDGYNVPLTGWSFTVGEGTLNVTNVNGGADYNFDDGVLTLTLKNERTTGSLVIYKHSASDKNEALSGAQFQIRDAENELVWFTVRNGVYYAADADTPGAGNVLSTNDIGKIVLEELPFGEYMLYEVTAPKGYELKSEKITLKLTKQDETLEVDVANEQLTRKVTVLKQSAGENPQNLIGAVFALYRVSEDGTPVFVSEATTGYDGKVEFTVPYGDYTIVETRAPEGYELSENQIWEFSYNSETPEDYEFTYTFSNEKTVYDLEIYKYDAEKKEKGLAGAEFAVTNSKGYTITIKSEADGVARLKDIEYDDYTIREVTAPDGYYLNEQVYTVTKDQLVHGKAVRIEVGDTKIIGSVLLRKVDFENHDKVLDAEFTVSDESGRLLSWKKTEDGYSLSDEGETVIHAGEVKLSGIPAGNYTITEVKAPAGYVILDESRTFTVNAETAVSVIEIEIENLLNKVAVGIIKMDSEDKAKRLAGAEFTLYPVENGVVGSALKTAVTNENGLAVFTDLPMGSYRIIETKAPYGFKLLSNSIDFVVDADGKVLVGKDKTELPEKDKIHMFGMLNTSILQEFEIKKISSESGKTLAGATFTISGEGMSWRVTTGKDGTATLSLPYGKYVLRELIAPDGYILDDTRHLVEVSESGIVIDGVKLRKFTYVVDNTPVTVALSLHKQDSSSAKALSGAEFQLRGNGKRYTLKTNASGNTDTIYLEPGQYTLSETKAPNGYKVPMSGWKLTIGEDGRVSVDGEGATVALNSVSVTVTVENTKPGGGNGGGSEIGKTGQISNSGLLLGGASMIFLSFTGLLALLIDEYRHRGKQDNT